MQSDGVLIKLAGELVADPTTGQLTTVSPGRGLRSVLYRTRQFPHAEISLLRESGRWKAGVIAASNA